MKRPQGNFVRVLPEPELGRTRVKRSTPPRKDGYVVTGPRETQARAAPRS